MATLTCEDNMDLMARYDDQHFDLAIVDPPYGINMAKGPGNKGYNTHYEAFAGGDTEIPSAEYFKELLRVSKNQIIWGGNYMTEHLPPSMCWIVWDKKQPEDFSMAMAELAWTSFHSVTKMFRLRNIGADIGNKVHPTQKPVKLYEWTLKMYAEENDKILDTHMGSGSIAIACSHSGHDLTACELHEGYYKAALERIDLETAQVRLL